MAAKTTVHHNSLDTDAKKDDTVTVPEQTAESQEQAEAEQTAENREQAEDDENDTGQEEQSQALIAKTYILYNSHQYSPGDPLPTNNPDMLKAWLAAGTAVWTNVAKLPVKACSVTAQPGLSGIAVSSEVTIGEDLVGRVPKTSTRGSKEK